jgi:hypothetical protein
LFNADNMAESSAVSGKMDAAQPVIGIPITTPSAEGGEESAVGVKGKLAALAGRAKEMGTHVVSQVSPRRLKQNCIVKGKQAE